MKQTIVVAKYNEFTGWLDQIKGWEPFIVEKGVHLPNEGRESLSYIWYILENWDNLEGYYLFVQGNPSPHWGSFINEINSMEPQDFKWCGCDEYSCSQDGFPQHNGLDIANFAKDIHIDIPEKLTFKAGGQFMVSASTILGKKKSFYEDLWALHEKYGKAPWIIERLWGYIFQV